VSRPVVRREFLKGLAGAGAIAAGGFGLTRLLRDERPVPWDERAFAPPGRAGVAVVPAASYDPALLEELVGEGLRTIGADIAGARVLLKPNLVEHDAGTSINTDPRLVASAASAIRRMGAHSVVVAEGPGHRRDTIGLVIASGLADTLRDVEVPFVDLNTDRVRPVELRSRYTQLGRVWLPETVLDADVVVSMPKMKTHHWVGITLSLKNLFGCLPGRVYGYPKNVLHWAGIQASILDLAGAIRPAYAIVDGITGMEGDGPIRGTPIDRGLLVFADDPVAADAVTAGMMGYGIDEVPYLEEAGRFLGQADPDRIGQRGEDPERFAMRFRRPPTADAVTAG
jgi:uncharacterized protein (DUF362 family)